MLFLFINFFYYSIFFNQCLSTISTILSLFHLVFKADRCTQNKNLSFHKVICKFYIKDYVDYFWILLCTYSQMWKRIKSLSPAPPSILSRAFKFHALFISNFINPSVCASHQFWTHKVSVNTAAVCTSQSY